MSQTRTFWDHSLILAIPFSRWGAEPYIVDPISFPSGILSRIVSDSADHPDYRTKRIHPFQQALLWRQELESNSGITKARIAAREGVSRARMTQIMNLLDLPDEIQHGMQHPPATLEIHSIGERALRQILSCRDRKSQLRLWQELLFKCQNLVRK